MKPVDSKSFRINSKSLQDSDHGKMDRRQLLQALGLTAGAAALGGSVAYGQEEQGPGLPRYQWMKEYPRSGQFKTIAVGHISYSVPNQRETRDWYIDVLGMEAVFDTGRSTALRFGVPWNHIYLGQANDANAKPTIGHMAYSIEKFRLDAVEKELQARGLPHAYDGPEMIHTDDPEGYRLQPSSLVAVFPGGGNAENVEGLGQEDGLKTELRKAPRPTYDKFVATAMNHISHNCVDYGKVRDYYVDLWGMKKVSDDGKVAVLEFGGDYGDPPQQVWLRGGVAAGQSQYVDHIGYSIENFNANEVAAELKRLGLNPVSAGPNAWAINDAAGYPIQICAERGVSPEDAYKPYA